MAKAAVKAAVREVRKPLQQTMFRLLLLQLILELLLQLTLQLLLQLILRHQLPQVHVVSHHVLMLIMVWFPQGNSYTLRSRATSTTQ